METQARIDELETRLALQDQSILELSDEMYRQQRRMGELEDQLRMLTQRLETLAAPAEARDPADEVPPHY
jgi:SlyX protein